MLAKVSGRVTGLPAEPCRRAGGDGLGGSVVDMVHELSWLGTKIFLIVTEKNLRNRNSMVLHSTNFIDLHNPRIFEPQLSHDCENLS